MKRIFLLLLAMAAVTFTFATPTVNEKVLQVFNAIYPGVENTKWYEHEDHYEAYFESGDVKCRVKFDLDGKVLSTLRYYGDKLVSPFLRAKLAQKHPGKTIYGVTEVNSDNELTYHVVLEDKKNWMHVKCDGLGHMETTQKFKKADQ